MIRHHLHTKKLHFLRLYAPKYGHQMKPKVCTGSIVSVITCYSVKCCMHGARSTPSKTCDPAAELMQQMYVLHCCKAQLKAPWWQRGLLCVWSPGYGLFHHLIVLTKLTTHTTCLNIQDTLSKQVFTFKNPCCFGNTMSPLKHSELSRNVAFTPNQHSLACCF